MDEKTFIETMHLWYATNYHQLQRASDDAGVPIDTYLMRTLDGAVSEILTVGDLTLNVTNATCFCDGKDIGLTRAELDVLAALMRSENKLVNTTALLEAAGWKQNSRSRGLSFLIYKLRQKTENSITQIITARGRGYRLHSG